MNCAQQQARVGAAVAHCLGRDATVHASCLQQQQPMQGNRQPSRFAMIVDMYIVLPKLPFKHTVQSGASQTAHSSMLCNLPQHHEDKWEDDSCPKAISSLTLCHAQYQHDDY